MTIGEKIRGIRTLKGLSQENMAEMLGLSLLSYGDIERGKKDVNMNRLEQIAELRAEKEKAEIEAKYWQEKCQAIQN